MLRGLSIRDIVLIDSLTLSFGPGLSVLTGETGAGKSILLDALGLATGARADSSLVRRGAARGQAVASFDVGGLEEVHALLESQGIAVEDDLLLMRRVIEADGGSRAFLNDQPCSVGLLRRVGDLLLETHGQHDERGLLDSAGHRALLDLYGGHDALLAATAEAYRRRIEVERRHGEAAAALAAARADEDWLGHALSELDALAPVPGEEARLAERRALAMASERLAASLAEIMAMAEGDGGIDHGLLQICRRLERLSEAMLADMIAPAVAAFHRAALEAEEGRAVLARVAEALDFDPREAERIEERLFALRALARKHRTGVDDLPALRETLKARLAALETGNDSLAALARERDEAEKAFEQAVAALTEARMAAARRLDEAVATELPPLRLGKARFRTRITPLERDGWTAEGGEQVGFEVATNAGADFGPMIRIASGGELARFVLALKVALAARSGVRTLVFDEVDRGIGGATADAVGERLARLAEGAQVLVVTHSPQVAARGQNHFLIGKSEQEGAEGPSTLTRVELLDDEARREEIARMLSGAEITDAARVAASSLLGASLS